MLILSKDSPSKVKIVIHCPKIYKIRDSINDCSKYEIFLYIFPEIDRDIRSFSIVGLIYSESMFDDLHYSRKIRVENPRNSFIE